jgi:hypothetical protein
MFKKELLSAWQIATFKKHVMHSVAQDKHKTAFGYYIIIAAAIIGAIGQQLFMSWFKPTLMQSLGMTIMQIIMTVIGIYVLSFIAKSIFKGHASHDQFFRVAAYAMIVMWISIIPALSIIGGIWGLILIFVILKVVHKLTTGGAIGTLIIGFVAMMIISAILSPIFAKLGYGGFKYKGGYDLRGGYEMEVPGEDGGTVKVDEGKMRITTPEGEVMEIEIPIYE